MLRNRTFYFVHLGSTHGDSENSLGAIFGAIFVFSPTIVEVISFYFFPLFFRSVRHQHFPE